MSWQKLRCASTLALLYEHLCEKYIFIFNVHEINFFTLVIWCSNIHSIKGVDVYIF